MAKVMSEMMGFEYSEEMDEMTPFYILSNTCKMKGASAVLNKKGTFRIWRKISHR